MSVSHDAFLKRQSDFWDNISQSWSLQNKNPVVGWYDYHNAFKEYDTVLFRNIPLTGKEIVLEYGCGPARNIVKWKDKFRRIDGVDIAPGCIDKAKVHLAAERLPEPNLWVNDGQTIPMVQDAQYDIVFCIIAWQHITSWSARKSLLKEFFRVLKPGGYFCWQNGFGPGHPRSVEYFADTFNTEAEFVDKDFRLEQVEDIQKDIVDAGFMWKEHVFTHTCKDEHPAWFWGQAQKPNA